MLARLLSHSCKPGIMQVEMLVHSKHQKGWLADSIDVEHLVIKQISPGRNRPFILHETQNPQGPASRPGLGTLNPHLNLPQLISRPGGGGRRRFTSPDQAAAAGGSSNGPVGAREEN